MTTSWEGDIIASSSVIHGGETLGTVQYLRRERFLLPDGRTEDIPVISGNAVRGALRDKAAEIYHAFLGRPQLSLPQAHLLWSGGAITKARSEPLSGERLRRVRAVCPPLALFGGGVAGRVISGTLTVGKMLPVCKELRHILPSSYQAQELPSYWDLTQLEEFSRFPDNEEEEKTLLMRFGMESFIPGTRFYWWANVDTRSETEASFFQDVLKSFLDGEIALGGSKSKGFGRVRAVQPHIKENLVNWRQHVLQEYSVEEVLEILEAIQ